MVIIIEGFSLVNEWPELYFLDDKQTNKQTLVFSKLIGIPPGNVWVACLARRRSNEERRVALSVERFGSKFSIFMERFGYMTVCKIWVSMLGRW